MEEPTFGEPAARQVNIAKVDYREISRPKLGHPPRHGNVPPVLISPDLLIFFLHVVPVPPTLGHVYLVVADLVVSYKSG